MTYFIHLPMKMEPIGSSETSAIKTQTPGNYPKRNKLHKLSSNPLAVANAFNSYFSSVAENLLIINFSGKNTTNNNDPVTYLQKNLGQLSSSMKLNNTTMHEIDKIIHSWNVKIPMAVMKYHQEF